MQTEGQGSKETALPSPPLPLQPQRGRHRAGRPLPQVPWDCTGHLTGEAGTEHSAVSQTHRAVPSAVMCMPHCYATFNLNECIYWADQLSRPRPQRPISECLSSSQDSVRSLASLGGAGCSGDGAPSSCFSLAQGHLLQAFGNGTSDGRSID